MAIDTDAFTIRPLRQDDLDSALNIQAASYPAFLLEDRDAFASRLAVPRSYCLAAERDGTLAAYLLAHGWKAEAPPPVGTVLEQTALTHENAPEILFIHDLAVSASGQGAGLGRKLVDHAFALAAVDGLGKAELIAVDGAAAYWRALGFAETGATPALAAKIAAYGADARWMTRDIPAP